MVRRLSARRPLLGRSLARYEVALSAAEREAILVWEALVARDLVARALREGGVPTSAQRDQLLRADTRLRELLARTAVPAVQQWRESVAAPSDAWWWQLAGKGSERSAGWNSILQYSAAFCLFAGAGLIAEVVRRFWQSQPDALSTLWAVAVAAGATSGVVALWQNYSEQARLRWSLLLLAFGLAVFLGVRPLLARHYATVGVAQIQRGSYDEARRSIALASALAPDEPVPLKNLAAAYLRQGRLDDAIELLQQALTHQPQLIDLYADLGNAYNRKGEFVAAAAVLQGGLDLAGGAPREEQDIKASEFGPDVLTVRYNLLSDLGWAYYAQNKPQLARRALEEARAYEKRLQPEQRNELPAVFLAEIAELEGRTEHARALWIDALRLIDGHSANDWERRQRAQERLAALGGLP